MSKPNILLVVCDQLSASALALYGGAVETPNLDRLAARGVTFDSAVCAAPTCSPSRASVVTGLYPHAHGVAHNVNRQDYPGYAPPATEAGIKASDVTTEGLLHRAGYSTHHVGKWHLSDEALPYYSSMFREHQEYGLSMQPVFDAVAGGNLGKFEGDVDEAREIMDWYGWQLPVSQTPAYREAVTDFSVGKRPNFVTKIGRLELPLQLTFDAQVAQRAEAILRHTREPFMLTCSFNLPHDPNVVPLPYYDRFDPDTLALPANADARDELFAGDLSRRIVDAIAEPGVREFLRVYYGMVSVVDELLGTLLDALETRGLADDTCVVFTADHGDMAGAHGMVMKGTRAMHDEVVRVPLVIAGPGVTPGRSRTPVSLVDLLPTLLDLTGQALPPTHGVSLKPYLLERQPLERNIVACERISWSADRTRLVDAGRAVTTYLRSEGWAYTRFEDGTERLYDLVNDPLETSPVTLEADLKVWRTALEDFYRTTDAPWREGGQAHEYPTQPRPV